MRSQSSSASKGKGRLEEISWRKAGLDQEWKEKRRTEMKASSGTEEAAWAEYARPQGMECSCVRLHLGGGLGGKQELRVEAPGADGGRS